MINGFNEQTAPLTDKELAAVPTIASALKRAFGKDNAVYNQQLCALAPGLTSARLRKIINHIRKTNLVPLLLASSKGYYIAENEQEVIAYEESLRCRESAIREVREAISNQRKDKFYGGHQGRLF